MREDIYEHNGPFPSDVKQPLNNKKLQFDMLKDEGAEMFARMVDKLHNQGVVFTVEQDFNLVWICL